MRCLVCQTVDLQNELKMRIDELRAAQEAAKKLANEKELLEQKLSRAEKKKLNEVILVELSWDLILLIILYSFLTVHFWCRPII